MRDTASPYVPKSVAGLTPEQEEQARRAYLLKRFWLSARGYWGRDGDKLAWFCSIALLGLIGSNVAFQYGINVWNCKLFDAIEQRNAGQVYSSGAVFPPPVLGSVFLVYVRMLMQRRWRSWLTKSHIWWQQETGTVQEAI